MRCFCHRHTFRLSRSPSTSPSLAWRHTKPSKPGANSQSGECVWSLQSQLTFAQRACDFFAIVFHFVFVLTRLLRVLL